MNLGVNFSSVTIVTLRLLEAGVAGCGRVSRPRSRGPSILVPRHEASPHVHRQDLLPLWMNTFRAPGGCSWVGRRPQVASGGAAGQAQKRDGQPAWLQPDLAQLGRTGPWGHPPGSPRLQSWLLPAGGLREQIFREINCGTSVSRQAARQAASVLQVDGGCGWALLGFESSLSSPGVTQ